MKIHGQAIIYQSFDKHKVQIFSVMSMLFNTPNEKKLGNHRLSMNILYNLK